MSDIDMPSYEIGYAEGGSSANADWMVTLSEFADIDAETPHEAVQKIKAAIRAAENDALEMAAQVFDAMDADEEHPACVIAATLRQLVSK